MKTKFFLCVIVFILLGLTFVKAQGFQPPSEGKAAVYFVPRKKAAVFEYFHNDKYIGVFGGKNYLRYECDPGKQLFWASSENKEFVDADLKAGGIYIVMVENDMGVWTARVSLTPVTQKSDEDFARIKGLVMKKAPTKISEEKLAEKNLELKEFIAEKLNMYNTEWKQKYPYSKITPDMAIPAESLK